MGDNNLDPVVDGVALPASRVNQFRTALTGDHVPRNASGVPTARGGSLGTQPTPWNQVHCDQLFVNGTEITGAGGTAAGAQNGVVSGKAPSGAPNMCGWLLPAGTSGVTIKASATDPLVVKLDGINYTITSDITGGTAPATLSQNYILQSYTTPSGGYNADEYYEYSQRTRPRFMLATGGIFRYSSGATPVAAANGDTFIFKHGSGASTGYIIAQRHVSSQATAKLAQRQGLNTSTSGFTHPYFDLPSNGAITLIRTGYVFLDPTTSTPTIAISNRLVGSVNVELPATTGYATGDVVWRKLDSRWYRFTGSAWTKTAYIYCGFGAWDGSAGCVGTQGVRGETAMDDLLTCRNATLGSSLFITGVLADGKIYFSGASDLEMKTTASIMAQDFDKVSNDPVIDVADDGTKENSKFYCCYLNCEDHSYFYDEIAPVIMKYGGRVIHAHPHKHALFFGSFATDSNGNEITRLSITGSQSASHTDYNTITESNDDAWWINPLLYFRMEFETPDENYYSNGDHRRYPDIELRQGTGTASRQFAGENIGETSPYTGAREAVEQFYTNAIQPMVLDGYRFEIYNSDIRASGRLRNWTEQEFIDHLGL